MNGTNSNNVNSNPASTASAGNPPNPPKTSSASKINATAATAATAASASAQATAQIKDLKDDEWEKAILPDLSVIPVNAYDHDLMPTDASKAFVKAGAAQKRCPPDYVAVSLIAEIGAVAGRRIVVRGKRNDELLTPLNFYGLIIGPPTSAKSPAMTFALAPMRRRTDILIAKYEAEKLVFAPKYKVWEIMEKNTQNEIKKLLIKAAGLKDAKDIKDAHDEALALQIGLDQAKPITPQEIILEVNSLTLQRLTQLCSLLPKGFMIFRDELSGFFIEMGSDSNGGMREFILTAYDGVNRNRYETKGLGTEASTPLLSLFGSVQFAKLKIMIDATKFPSSKDDGFMQRFSLMVFPDVTPDFRFVDIAFDQQDAKWLDDLLERLVNQHDMVSPLTSLPDPLLPSVVMQLDDGAYRYYEKEYPAWAEELANPIYPPYLINHFKKYERTIFSIAGVLALIEDSNATGVSEKAMRLAFEWIAYLKSHAIRIYGHAPSNHNHDAYAYLSDLAKHLGNATPKDLPRSGNWSFARLRELKLGNPIIANSGAILKNVLDVLVEYGWARTVKSDQRLCTNGIKHNVSYRFHPDFFNGKALKQILVGGP